MQQLAECLCELKRDQRGHLDTSSGGAESTVFSSLAVVSVTGARSSQEVLFGFAFQPMGRGLRALRAVSEGVAPSCFRYGSLLSWVGYLFSLLYTGPLHAPLPLILPWRKYFCPILF